MSRREEIISESKKHEYDWGVDVDRFDVPDIFAKAAEWADKTMIEKICEWIGDNVENAFVCVDGIMTELNGIELSKCICKVMEE